MTERIRSKSELKRLFTNLRRKVITDNMMSILIDVLWRSRIQSDWDQEDPYQPDYVKNKPPGIHDPVTIDPGSDTILSIDSNQVLSINTQTLGGGGSDTPDTTETPAGDVNDVNTDFTLSQTPVASTLRVYLNGIRQKAGLNFTLATDVISFAVAPFTGDVIIADYKPYVPSLTRVWNETPAGDVDGVNTNFVLLHTPSSVYVYLNGIRQQPLVSYTITGDTITFTDVPFENDVIICDYEY